MHWRWAWGTDAPYRLQVFRLCHWPPGHWSLLTGTDTSHRGWQSEAFHCLFLALSGRRCERWSGSPVTHCVEAGRLFHCTYTLDSAKGHVLVNVYLTLLHSMAFA